MPASPAPTRALKYLISFQAKLPSKVPVGWTAKPIPIWLRVPGLLERRSRGEDVVGGGGGGERGETRGELGDPLHNCPAASGGVWSPAESRKFHSSHWQEHFD